MLLIRNLLLLAVMMAVYIAALTLSARLLSRPARPARPKRADPVVDDDLPCTVPQAVMVSRSGRILEVVCNDDGWAINGWIECLHGWMVDVRDVPTEGETWAQLSRMIGREQ